MILLLLPYKIPEYGKTSTKHVNVLASSVLRILALFQIHLQKSYMKPTLFK